jgi:hypothetical protein
MHQGFVARATSIVMLTQIPNTKMAIKTDSFDVCVILPITTAQYGCDARADDRRGCAARRRKSDRTATRRGDRLCMHMHMHMQCNAVHPEFDPAATCRAPSGRRSRPRPRASRDDPAATFCAVPRRHVLCRGPCTAVAVCLCPCLCAAGGAREEKGRR